MPVDYRASLVRPCLCGHLKGDHAHDAPHPCLRIDRRQAVLFGRPRCHCLNFQEPK